FVVFPLPPGVKNTSETRVTIEYTVRLRAPLPFLTIAMALLLGVAGYGRQVATAQIRRRDSILRGLLKAPIVLTRATGYLALLASCLYVACTVYAQFKGWALPTTALIRWSRLAEWAARKEPLAAYVLLTLAALGAISSWAAAAFPRHASAEQNDELVLVRFCRRWGFLLAACAFVFSLSATWSGVVRQGDADFA